jgi:hypothetical protein
VIIIGKRFFGKVDCVPGLFYIATTFIHVFYFPIIPLGSCIVLANSRHTTRYGATAHMVFKTGFSFKSWLTAYVRGILIGATILSIAAAVMTYFDLLLGLKPYAENGSLWVVTGSIASISFGLTYLSYKFCKASEKRARALGKAAGFQDEAVLRAIGVR